jgi:hypothetical protein
MKGSNEAYFCEAASYKFAEFSYCHHLRFKNTDQPLLKPFGLVIRVLKDNKASQFCLFATARYLECALLYSPPF